MITQLKVENFCAFKKLELSFSPKLNIVIGENSFGKTQLLKAAYTLGTHGEFNNNAETMAQSSVDEWFTDKLLRVYKPSERSLRGLHHRGGKGDALIQVEQSDGHCVSVSFSKQAKAVRVLREHKKGIAPGVFIPTKEVLTLLPGIANKVASTDVLESLFDDSIIDLCKSLLIESSEDVETRINADPRLGELLPTLAKAIGGRYEIAKTHQCFVPGAYKEKKAKPKSQQEAAYADSTVTSFVPVNRVQISSNMTAEGFRKIGMLQKLLSNGVIDPGTTGPLLWDEPESSMNPKLMKTLVECLLTLSRNGQQIILATHDYVLLKWVDLLSDSSKDDHVRYHALYSDPGSKNICVNSDDDYSITSGTAISDVFAELYDADIERALG